MPFDICLNKGRLVGDCIKAEWVCEGGGNCVKYLKRAWNRKEGKGSRDLKNKGGGEQAGPRGGCLKKGGGAGTPL